MEAQSWQKEQFSCAYLHALAAHGGLTVGSWNVDKDGVDATLRRGALMVDFQLKCTQTLREDEGGYSFDLDVPTYNKLRGPDRSAPGYLAVVEVPADVDEWIGFAHKQMVLRCAGFYARMQDRPPVSSTSTTRIHIPRSNKLNAESLRLMFDHASRLVGRRTHVRKPPARMKRARA